MKGSVQLCKADVCLKADGDYAKIILAVVASIFFIGLIASIAKQ